MHLKTADHEIAAVSHYLQKYVVSSFSMILSLYWMCVAIWKMFRFPYVLFNCTQTQLLAHFDKCNQRDKYAVRYISFLNPSPPSGYN
jgi:hypothetical protein